MKFIINKNLIIGCDRDSEIYCTSFNVLSPALSDDYVDISLNNVNSIDMSALGLYIGKYLEQEFNSSIVQLMRSLCGIEMPKYYRKRDTCESADRKCTIKTNQKTICLNSQQHPRYNSSLKNIALGDAHYIFYNHFKEEYKSFIEAHYPWLLENQFECLWRQLFVFRNQVAHMGIVKKEDFLRGYEYFNLFLTEYMPKITSLKNQLKDDSHEDVYEDRICHDIQESNNAEKSTHKEGWTYVFKNKIGLMGMKNPNGEIIIPACYEDIKYVYVPSAFNLAYIPVKKHGKWGIVESNGSGNEYTEFIYDDLISIPWCNCYYFKKDNCCSWGIMFPNGKVILDCILDKLDGDQCSNTFFLYSGDKLGLFQTVQSWAIIPPICDNIEFYEPDEPILFTINGTTGYMEMPDEDMHCEFIPKSRVDAIEDEDEKYDRMLEFLCLQYGEA